MARLTLFIKKKGEELREMTVTRIAFCEKSLTVHPEKFHGGKHFVIPMKEIEYFTIFEKI